VSGQIHAPAALPPGERAPGTHWVGAWVGPRAGLDDVVAVIIIIIIIQEVLGRTNRLLSLIRHGPH
jgi:hypothetical protein